MQNVYFNTILMICIGLWTLSHFANRYTYISFEKNLALYQLEGLYITDFKSDDFDERFWVTDFSPALISSQSKDYYDYSTKKIGMEFR